MTREKREGACEETVVHRDRVERALERFVDEETFLNLSETFRAMGDSTRVKILFALQEEELCVCDLAYLLGLSPSAVSHQLRVLRNLKLVKFRKEGRNVYYSLDDDHIRTLFAQCLEHVTEKK